MHTSPRNESMSWHICCVVADNDIRRRALGSGANLWLGKSNDSVDYVITQLRYITPTDSNRSPLMDIKGVMINLRAVHKKLSANYRSRAWTTPPPDFLLR